ncbi:response regulator transcription factor [Fulvivirgaceae bacterium BMA10]|uniref:Response regulator transcription factor n=1 Tax=Splendidivirga corallicola TaxID=3051826 RepID=A0ABT8KRU5_9BACT|nr:response regulator transcription factor [Fulvivirgaceae bacterium BMA10]
MKKIKLIIADDHELFRRGITAILEDIPEMEVIDQAENGEHLMEILETKQPDVILMDIKMPVMDGIECTKLIIAKYPEIKVIMLTMHDDEKFITHLVDMGANGYLLKNAEIDEVENAIKTVMMKGFYFNREISEIVLNGLINKRSKHKIRKDTENITLSDREYEVLELICQGFTNAEIGRKLFLSQRTVEGYRYKLLDKVGVKNTAGLVRFALKNGLVD